MCRDLSFNDWWDLQGIPLLSSWTYTQSWQAKILLAAGLELMISTCFSSVPHSLESWFFSSFSGEWSSWRWDKVSLTSPLIRWVPEPASKKTYYCVAKNWLGWQSSTRFYNYYLAGNSCHKGSCDCPLSSISLIVKGFPAHPNSLPWKHKQKHYWKYLVMNLA